MKPQHVARQSSSKEPFEAFVTQHVAKAACGYLFATRWRRFRTQVHPSGLYLKRGRITGYSRWSEP